MIYADTPKAVQDRLQAFLRKWRLRCPAVATSLEEADDRLFAFLRLPSSQWKSARTTNAVERLHQEFKRRIKTQTVLPSAESAAMLFWALIGAGRPIEHPGWNFQPTIPASPGQRAAERNAIYPRDRLMNGDLKPAPGMPRIQQLPEDGPVGVLKPCSTTRSDPTQPWGT